MTVKKLKLLANDNNRPVLVRSKYVDRSKENPENFLDGLSITTKSEFYGKQGLGFNIIIYESLAGSTRNNLDARFALQKWAHIYSDVTHRAVLCFTAHDWIWLNFISFWYLFWGFELLSNSSKYVGTLFMQVVNDLFSDHKVECCCKNIKFYQKSISMNKTEFQDR